MIVRRSVTAVCLFFVVRANSNKTPKCGLGAQLATAKQNLKVCGSEIHQAATRYSRGGCCRCIAICLRATSTLQSALLTIRCIWR